MNAFSLHDQQGNNNWNRIPEVKFVLADTEKIKKTNHQIMHNCIM